MSTKNIVPRANGEGSLGTSDKKWNSINTVTINATNINGTATKASQDSEGNVINTTYAPIANPTFTGAPKAPNASTTSNDTQVATTAWVQAIISNSLHANGVNHNSIYRGKNLGVLDASNIETFLTEHEVSEGKFTDLYIGDYVTINADFSSVGHSDRTTSAEWAIAGFDYHYQDGDSPLTTHHICLIPRSILFRTYMNSSNTTAGGYYGSYMHQTIMPKVNTILSNILGSHLLTRRALLTNSVSTTLTSAAYSGYTGASSNWAWYDVKACLMSESAVYGSNQFNSSFFDTGEEPKRLPIFNFVNQNYFRTWFWLRGVASASDFCHANFYGLAYLYGASYTDGGVRPLICIG